MQRLSLYLVVVSACIPALAWPLAAHAQHGPLPGDQVDEARGLFQAGRAAYDAGRYQDALEYFEHAFDLSHKDALLYNIGLAADRLRDDDKALTAYEAYLERLPNADNRNEVDKRVAALRAAFQQKRAATSTSRAPLVAPTPAQTASARLRSVNADLVDGDAHSTKLVTQWWFWTAAGVLAVGAVVGIAALTAHDTRAAPIETRSGVTIMTLRTP